MHKRNVLVLVLALVVALACGPTSKAADVAGRWSEQKAAGWYAQKSWLVGSNYIPSTAINQLEMWQADTFDPATIDRELGWAEDLGCTSMRVFLHHLAWEQDKDGFIQRMDKYLEISSKHHIGTMFVLWDSVWDPNPRIGKQREPKRGVHNSGFVQSPGAADLKDPARQPVLEAYVKAVLTHFKDDKRIDAWDLHNEPDNTNGNSYGANGTKQEPANKVALSLALLKNTFTWARQVNPSQPLTSGVWQGDWSADKLSDTAKVQLENSDIISYHSYDPIEELKRRTDLLRRYNRPLICTEYMARPRNSTFQSSMPFFKEGKIGAYNWGFVTGKSQTNYPWDSWQKPYASEPKPWFHDIFRANGEQYDPAEVTFIKQMTGKTAK